MKSGKIWTVLAAVFLGTSLVAFPTQKSSADDTELFTQPPGTTPPPPQIMFMLDNTANWSRASQMWPDASTAGLGETQSIAAAVGGINKPAYLGLSMFNTSPGSYVRFNLRDMFDTANPSSTANYNAFASIVNGIGANVNSPSEKISSTGSSPGMDAGFYEMHRYFNSQTSISGSPPSNSNADYSGNAGTYTGSGQRMTSNFAYASSGANALYTPPTDTSGCAKKYVILMVNNSNGSYPTGVATINGVTVNGTTVGGALNYIPSWAAWLKNQDNVTTYVLDAYNAQQNASYSSMLSATAKAAGGRYFAVKSSSDIQTALTQIFNEIQSVNTVFAAATLPVSVNVRGTNLNQVYLGVFRPDPDALPNWPGNLKEYKLGLDASGNLLMVDSTGAAALSASTGFFNTSALSYWTSSNTYWTFNPSSTAQNPNSDSADGPLVERGGANQVLRVDNTSPGNLKLASNRKVYTYVGSSPVAGSPVALNSNSNYLFSTSNSATLTPAMFGLTAASDMNNVIDWIRGADLNVENTNGSSLNLRPKVHGDVIHSRPAVINYNRYGDEDDVALFYGANDGLLHALQGGQTYSLSSVGGRAAGAPTGGQEMWSFAAPEFFANYPRQYNNFPIISWSTTPASFAAHAFAASGSTSTSIYNINLNVASGQTVTGAGLSAGTTVSSASSIQGFKASSASTATASGVTLQMQPPGEQVGNSPITDAKLTLLSKYVSFNSGSAPPSWLAAGMTLSGSGIAAGTTVSTLVASAGAALNGGVTATSANAGANYTFSAQSGGSGSGTTVSNLLVTSGSTIGYVLSGSAATSTVGQSYSSSNTGSTLGSALPAGSTIASTGSTAVALSYASGLYAGGVAGAVDTGLTLKVRDVTLTGKITGTSANSVQTCAANSTCTGITTFPSGSLSSVPSQGDVISVGSCSGLTMASGSTATSLNIVNSGSTACAIGTRSSITIYPIYQITNAIQVAGQDKIVASASSLITRGGSAATLPLNTVIDSVSGLSNTSLPGTLTVTRGTVPTETLSAAASVNAFGNANYASPSTLTTVAICTGNTVVGGTSITSLGTCSTGSTALITSGLVVTGPGIPTTPTYTTTAGILNPGFVMSVAATSTSAAAGQALTAYVPWIGNTVSGSYTVQVTNPVDLSAIPIGWTVAGSGVSAGTTLVDNAIGEVQFVTLSSATTSAANSALWTFTSPSAVSSNTGPKPYFFDGPIGVYRYDAPNTGVGASPSTGDGKIIAGSCNASNASDCDQAIIFVPMRRGGRMIYAFDVTDPTAPKLLWKHGCTLAGSCDAGFEEMGYTFSMPQSYNMNIGGTTTPVIIMAGGYDQTNDDQDPSLNMANRTMGRAIYFINAKTGALIKTFKGISAAANGLGGTTEMGVAQQVASAGMNCSIPSDVSALTKDPSTGFTVNVFRAYVGDTCGQIWRLDTADSDPANWIVTKLASVGQAYYRSVAGGSLTGNSLAVQSRKFLFAPDVVYGGSDTAVGGGSFHYVLMGSGDREHPFNGYGDVNHPAGQSVINRFYMFKDYNIGTNYTARTGSAVPLTTPPPVFPINPATGLPALTSLAASGTLPYIESDLYDATSDLVQLGSTGPTGTATIARGNFNQYNGWYITLGTAEKTVGGATSSSGYVYFGTNQPATSSNVCSTNLGTARLYQVNIGNAGAPPSSIVNGVSLPVTSATQRYTTLAGGGLPPTPVPVSVVINGQSVEGVIAGTTVSTPALSIMGNRIRTYTKKLIDKK